MSRNRCRTECECGFWSFSTESELPIDSPGMLTGTEYLAAIDWSDCRYSVEGYGYRADMDGREDWWWRSPDGMGATSAVYCDRPGWVRTLSARYGSVAQGDRYRFRHLICPLCGRQYAGWYVQNPSAIAGSAAGESWSKPKWELYDSSFWSAYNDEPADADGPTREINPDVVRAAVEAWYAQKGSVTP